LQSEPPSLDGGFFSELRHLVMLANPELVIAAVFREDGDVPWLIPLLDEKRMTEVDDASILKLNPDMPSEVVGAQSQRRQRIPPALQVA
jgi:hypothetical protein